MLQLLEEGHEHVEKVQQSCIAHFASRRLQYAAKCLDGYLS